jgi:hypothetical protein
MVDRMNRAGFHTGKEEDFPEGAEGEASAGAPPGGAPKPPGSTNGGGGSSDAEKQAQVAANRARMQAMNAKK